MNEQTIAFMDTMLTFLIQCEEGDAVVVEGLTNMLKDYPIEAEGFAEELFEVYTNSRYLAKHK